MPRRMYEFLAAATLSGAVAIAAAQSPDQGVPNGARQVPDQSFTQEQMPAPVERAWAGPADQQGQGAHSAQAHEVVPGVLLLVGKNSDVTEVAKTAERVELRVEQGLANVNVHDPAKNTLILVDLPGGQTQVLKNGLYTFNADTNTVRVLKGEALAFAGTEAANAKPIKVKEEHKVVFGGERVRSQDFYPVEAQADVIPGSGGRAVLARNAYGAYGPYGYGPYGDGFYGYPYYAYGYPWGWGWGDPYAFYPYPMGFSLGFGYVGGFHGGGYHGGGFHGRR